MSGVGNMEERLAPVKTFDRIEYIEVYVVGQVGQIIAIILCIKGRNHHECLGTCLNRYPLLGDNCRQLGSGLADPVLHVDLGLVGISPGLQRSPSGSYYRWMSW